MFFIISKTVTIFLMPIYWLVALGLGWLFAKKLKVFFKKTFITTFIILTNPFLINTLMLGWEIAPIPIDRVGKFEIGIVLTGVVNSSKTPQDRIHMAEGADRLLHALMLYRQGKIKKILITGGNVSITGKVYASEARKLATILLQEKVDEADIIIEENARNTRENALFTKAILDKHFPNSAYLLITSGFHMRRAVACFEKVGIKVTPFSAGFYTQDFYNTLHFGAILPTEKSLYLWQIWVHEFLGYLTYKMVGYA